MLAAIKGYYEKGQIVLAEAAPVSDRTNVIITFLTEEVINSNKPRVPGVLKGKVTIPDDFNEPLDDLKGYM